MQLVLLISYALQAYIMLIFVWVLGSWFPQWRSMGWYRMVESLVRPYMDLFRALPLRIGMMDLTPMVAIFILIIFQRLLKSAAAGAL
ncbi:YggT family protein [bacterium]|nr:YggT family protein [bacterium]